VLDHMIFRADVSRRVGQAAIAACLVLTPALQQARADVVTDRLPPVLPVEESDTAVLTPGGPHRVLTLPGFTSTAGAIVEGGDEQLKVLGSVPTPVNASIALSRDGSKIYVGETYWSRGNRGDRADLLSVYDARTLNLEKEIPIPDRLHVVAKVGQMGLSDDDKLAYVYALMPSSTAHVVDLAAGKLMTSVDLAGCALVYPYGPRGFASICGDGTIATATVPAGGVGEAKVSFSPKFFDPDADPLFENSIVDRTTGEGWFLSYSGKIYPAKLGATPKIEKPWSVNEAADLPVAGTGVQELAWRPGGGQLMALHRATKRLYIVMHMGNYWTQKKGGPEVWILDATTKRLVRRVPLAAPVKSIAVTQDDKPILFAFGGEGAESSGFTAYDAVTGKKLRNRELSATIALVPGL